MTLNLLPPEYKHQLDQKRSWQKWQRAAIFAAIVAGFCVGGLIVSQQRLQQHATQLQNELDALRTKTEGSPVDEITTVTTRMNSTISTLSKTLVAPRSWAADLTSIAAIIPDQVTIQTLTLTGSGSLTIQGTALTRLSFITLDEALKNSPMLTEVTTTSTPSKRENLPFSYSAVFRTTSQP